MFWWDQERTFWALFDNIFAKTRQIVPSRTIRGMVVAASYYITKYLNIFWHKLLFHSWRWIKTHLPGQMQVLNGFRKRLFLYAISIHTKQHQQLVTSYCFVRWKKIRNLPSPITEVSSQRNMPWLPFSPSHTQNGPEIRLSFQPCGVWCVITAGHRHKGAWLL